MIVKSNKLRMPALFAALGLLAGCSGAGKTEEKMSAALAQAKQGRWEKAGSMAEEISAAAPNAMPPLLLRAIVYERNGEFAKALDLARQCAAMEPEDFTAQYTFGRLSAGDPMRRSEAFGILEHALRLNPDDRNTLVLLCNLGTELNHPRLDTYLERLRRQKEFATSGILYYQYGLRRARQQNKSQALLFLRHAVKCGGGGNPKLILNAARCIDRYALSPSEARNMYSLFLRHPGRKSATDLAEAEIRVAGLSR